MLLKKTIKLLFYFFLYSLCFFVYFVIKIVSPFILIRFGSLRNDVIGNSLFDLEFYLSYKKKYPNKIKTIDFFFPRINKYPNSFFKLMSKRHLNVSYYYKYMFNITNFFRDKKHLINMINPKNGSRDVIGLFENTQTNYYFTDEENNIGQQFLNKYHVTNKKFVCLLVRDNSYKKNFQSHIKNDWSYHNYRNTDVKNFEKSVKYLLKNDYAVIRMGKSAEKKLLIDHKDFVDYPFIEDKSDFLDIWLMANCEFCITTGTGLDDVCVTFRKPIVEVSYLPLGHIRCNQAFTVSIFKKLKDKNSKNYLSISKQIDTGLINSHYYEEYDNNKVNILDNTENEILDAVKEMKNKLNNKWVENDEDLLRQKQFFENLKKWTGFDTKIGKIHINSRIGQRYLKDNIKWLIS